MNETSEAQGQTEEAQVQTEEVKPVAAGKKSGQTILALSVFALGLNAAAAVYTNSPADFALPDVRGIVAELLPQQRASAPIPDTVVAALNDIQSTQQHTTTSLQDNWSQLQHNATALQDHGALLQQNNILLQQGTDKLDILRSSLTDEQSDVKTIQSDVKTIATQLSSLIAKVDALPRTMSSEFTSSIPKDRAQSRAPSVARKHLARRAKPESPFLFDGAPFMIAPATGRSHSQGG